MAEKLVEMSKMAPFGLQIPSAEDVAVLEKLWTHKTRLLDEKAFYLNKSNTKYVMIGIDSGTFYATIRICDRTNGCHVIISQRAKILKFMELVKKILDEEEIDAELELASGISARKMMHNIVKLDQQTGYGTVVLHKTNLENIVINRVYIEREVKKKADKSPQYIKVWRDIKSGVRDLNTSGLDEADYHLIEFDLLSINEIKRM